MQFRLKNKYPGLPNNWEVGMIVGHGDRNVASYYSPINGKYTDKHIRYLDCKNYPLNWEPVGDYIPTIVSKGFHYHVLGELESAKDYLDKGFVIHQAKCTKNSNVYEVGQPVVFYNKMCTIEKIYCNEHGQLSFKVNGRKAPLTGVFMYNHSHLSKYVPKAFVETTYDNKTIYEGDSYWWIRKGTWRIEFNIASIGKTANKDTYLYFSSKESAEHWVKYNKPVLSVADVQKAIPKLSNRLLSNVVEIATHKIESNGNQ